MSHAPASIRLTVGDVKRLEAKVRAELHRTQAQRADTARLDWLEAQQSYSLSNLGGGPKHHLYISESDAEQSVRTVRTATKGGLREVIDSLRGEGPGREHAESAEQLLTDIIEQALERAFDAGASNNTMPGWEGIEQLAITTATEIREEFRLRASEVQP